MVRVDARAARGALQPVGRLSRLVQEVVEVGVEFWVWVAHAFVIGAGAWPVLVDPPFRFGVTFDGR